MLSYSSLRTSPKVTLPSVEMWGTNMNILRDPPKSVYTRRIDKVSDTQQITLQEADSNDRRLENINVYARNVNPMVGVSYNNYGNSTNKGSGQKQATLPYKVENVRPPLLSQYDLQPLSRLPRDWFYTFSNPEFPQVFDNLQCNDVNKCIQQKVKATDVITNKLKEVYLPLNQSELLLNRTPLHIDTTTQKTFSGASTMLSDSSIPSGSISFLNKNPKLPERTNKTSTVSDIRDTETPYQSLLSKMEQKSSKNRRSPHQANKSKEQTTIHPKTVFRDCKKIVNLKVDSQKNAPVNNANQTSPLQQIRINDRQWNGSAETSKDIRYYSSGQILEKNLPILQTKLPSYKMTTNLSGSGESDTKNDVVYKNNPSKNIAKDVQTPSLFYFEPKNTYMNTKMDLKNTLKSGSFDPTPTSVPSTNIENENLRTPLCQNRTKSEKKNQLLQMIRSNTTEIQLKNGMEY